MLTRRGFLGALAAIVAAPRALLDRFTAARPSTIGSLGTYHYKVTYVTASGETPATTLSFADAVARGDAELQRFSQPQRIYRSTGDGPYICVSTMNPHQSHFNDDHV